MIRLAMVGTSPENGHPYSWSAIINGYDPKLIRRIPYPWICKYLSEVDIGRERVRDAVVSHIWSWNREEAENVARTCFIPNVVDDYRDLLNQIDAVILPYDDSGTHYELSYPFLSKGIPVLVDKPLADNLKDAYAFKQLVGARPILMSCSALRFSQQVKSLKESVESLGTPLLSYGISRRQWMKYGIHLVEICFAILGGGVESVRNVGVRGKDIVILRYPDGKEAILMVYENLGRILHFGICGTERMHSFSPRDWFYMFRETLMTFVKMVQTGKSLIKLDETIEIIRVLVGAEISQHEGQRIVYLDEL